MIVLLLGFEADLRASDAFSLHLSKATASCNGVARLQTAAVRLQTVVVNLLTAAASLPADGLRPQTVARNCRLLP